MKIGGERHCIRKIAGEGARIVEDDEREHDAHADKRQPLQRRPVSHRLIRPPSPRPHPDRDGQRQHHEQLREEQGNRNRQLERLPGRELESSAEQPAL